MIPGLVALGGSLLGGLFSGSAQKKAARTASNAQVQATQLGVDETSRQFDALQEILAPYVGAGESALSGMLSLAGVGGGQQQAIDQIAKSPEMAALTQQGENAILQNAAATGGVRGGNTQSALAQFRPQMLSQLINQQYSRLGGIAGMGQASAAGVGAAGMSAAAKISELFGDQGAARAGQALAAGKANANMFGNMSQFVGGIAGLSKDNVFGKGVF